MNKRKVKRAKAPRKWEEFQPQPTEQPPVRNFGHLLGSLIAYVFLYPRRLTIFCALCVLSCFCSRKKHNWAHSAFIWVLLRDDFFDNATTILEEDIIPYVKEASNDKLNSCVPDAMSSSVSALVNRHIRLNENNKKYTKIVLSRQLLIDWLDTPNLHGTEEGAYFESAFDYVFEYGLPEEQLHPYEGLPKFYYPWIPQCLKYKIGGFERLSNFDFHDIISKQVVASMFSLPGYEDHTGRSIWNPEYSLLNSDTDMTKSIVMHAAHIIGYGKENGVNFFIVIEFRGLGFGFWGMAKIRCDLLSRFMAPVLADDEDFMVFV